ncbi:glycine rich domain-containing protein, partial [Clostridioides difficile]
MQTVWDFDYTGTEQNVTLKPGKYKLECWGASGGETHSASSHSSGGYSVGELILRKKTLLYIYVGQLGLDVSSSVYAFNGGGYGAGAVGGGATDIRLIGGAWDNEQGLFSRIIVAGGGGGGYSSYGGGNGGGLKGENVVTSDGSSVGATQFDGGRGFETNGKGDGLFGKGGCSVSYAGGGGGWFGGSGCHFSHCNGGGGSGYVLTKDSYKPIGYTPASEYWLENASTTVGKTLAGHDGINGRAKITLLQTLPFLTVSSYNSTQAIFKADHTDPTLLTKIEYFIDDVLKETITTALTEEKTINYTLEDNAIHTLKIVVTDSANATAEKVVSISKGI